MFLGHPGPDDSVTIILQDIGREDVQRVLEFAYTGAAVVPGHGMDGFVTAAGALGIGPLLDPRRHLEMSAVRPPPSHRYRPYHGPHCPTPAYGRTPRPPPRTTGILTPSPWAQNSRPPCAAPKHSALHCRTAAEPSVESSVATIAASPTQTGVHTTPPTAVTARLPSPTSAQPLPTADKVIRYVI